VTRNGVLLCSVMASALAITSCGPAQEEGDRRDAHPSPEEARAPDPLEGVEGLIEVTGNSVFVIDPDSGQTEVSFGFEEAAGHECAEDVTSLIVRENLEHLSWGSRSGFCIAHLDSETGTYAIGHVSEIGDGDFYAEDVRLSDTYFDEKTESFWYGVDTENDGEVEVFSLPLNGDDYGAPVSQAVLTDAGSQWWLDDQGEPRPTRQVTRAFDNGEFTHLWDGANYRPTMINLRRLSDGRIVNDGVFRGVIDIGDGEYLALLDNPITPKGDFGQIISFGVSSEGEAVDMENVIEPTNRTIRNHLWDPKERRVLFRDTSEGFYQVDLDAKSTPEPMPQLHDLAERHRESEQATSKSAHRLVGFYYP
jgi:hypothetical protein